VIKLHVVQAEFGDCFILESKSGNDSVNVLIDGGPYQTFEKHLKPTIKKVLLNGKIDLMILSHIDNDHIIGLLDLLGEIKNQREGRKKELVKVEKIWHNSFSDLLELHGDPNKLLGNIFSPKNMGTGPNVGESLVLKGFQQGTDLTKLANGLKIPINPDFDKIIAVNDKIISVRLKNISIFLLGPTKKNVDELREKWNKWSSKKKMTNETLIGLLDLVDKSVPNLASITFLVRIKDKKILFTGDGLGKDIIDVLSKNMMLDKDGKFYVDVLKVPHHGSDRNTSPEFFKTVVASYYVISANGRDDNPSLDTLKWIFESENKGKKAKKIVLTNMTPNVKKILQEYAETKYGYVSIVLDKKSDFLTINL
jgi:hypothetical protein